MSSNAVMREETTPLLTIASKGFRIYRFNVKGFLGVFCGPDDYCKQKREAKKSQHTSEYAAAYQRAVLSPLALLYYYSFTTRQRTSEYAVVTSD